jgi:tetrahydromethanopterin S-methyltransferase subunit B
MSVQAQIREWVDDAMRVVLDPLFARLDKLEEKVKAFENGSTAERSAAKAAPSHDRPAARPATTAKAGPATGRGTSGSK